MLRLLAVLMVGLGLLAGGLGVAGLLRAHDQPRAEISPAPEPPQETTEPLSTSPSAATGASGVDGASADAARSEPQTRVQPATADGSDMVKRLRTVPIAHEVPEQARFGRAFEVSLVIDATGAESAAGTLPGTGRITESEAQVASEARALLSGPAFRIEGLSPTTQSVSTLAPNTWRWNVTPLESGAHDLVVEIFAVEAGRVLPVRSYRDRVTVQVSTLGKAISLAEEANPVFMLLGGIGSVLGGLFAAARFFKTGKS